MKRTDGVISWGEYFMGIALFSGKRSKDPNTQLGCCIVSPDNVIMSIGYNGFPRGCGDDQLPWGRTGSLCETKYPYVVHAELNAILNSNRDLRGCKLYVGMHPCNECTKAIIQSGIKEVYYLSDKYHNLPEYEAARKMFSLAGIKVEQFKTNLKELTINYEIDKI